MRICLGDLASVLVATQSRLAWGPRRKDRERHPGYRHWSDSTSRSLVMSGHHLCHSTALWCPEGSLPVRPGAEMGSPSPGAPTCRAAPPPVMNGLFTVVDGSYCSSCGSAPECDGAGQLAALLASVVHRVPPRSAASH